MVLIASLWILPAARCTGPKCSGSIRRANLDGSELTTLVTGQFGVSNILVILDTAGGNMYWTSTRVGGDIRRANLDGSGQEILDGKEIAPRVIDVWLLIDDTVTDSVLLLRVGLEDSGQHDHLDPPGTESRDANSHLDWS
jgi:hypothetical protein